MYGRPWRTCGEGREGPKRVRKGGACTLPGRPFFVIASLTFPRYSRENRVCARARAFPIEDGIDVGAFA